MKFIKTNRTMDKLKQTVIDKALDEIISLVDSPRFNFYDSEIVKKAYFVGGTLWIDFRAGGFGNFALVNIDSETISCYGFQEYRGTKLLSISQLRKVFYIYSKIKGFGDYYRNAYGKSCIRHLGYSELIPCDDVVKFVDDSKINAI